MTCPAVTNRKNHIKQQRVFLTHIHSGLYFFKKTGLDGNLQVKDYLQGGFKTLSGLRLKALKILQTSTSQHFGKKAFQLQRIFSRTEHMFPNCLFSML